MATFSFTLLLQGPNPLEHEALDALYAAGCDDAAVGQRGPLYYADFDRESSSFAAAVSTAIREVEGAVPGLKVVRVEPEELVSASAIAQRLGRSRESVRLLIAARRGPGGFPPPANWVGRNRPLWRWVDVVNWFATCYREQPVVDHTASFVAALNGALDIRHHAAGLTAEAERDALVGIIARDVALLGLKANQLEAKVSLVG
jgi:hypothetical protein